MCRFVAESIVLCMYNGLDMLDSYLPHEFNSRLNFFKLSSGSKGFDFSVLA